MIAEDWEALIIDFKNVVKQETNEKFPQDVNTQLMEQFLQYFCHGKVTEQNLQKNKSNTFIGEQQ